MENDSLFIEQAEYIKQEDFIEWSSDHPDEEVILKKLTQAGAKLITGPRGCGKTTLILKAYNKLIQKKSKGAFPIYVNFKASLRLEPIYKSKANGGFWFAQWMYLKIYEGIYKSLSDSHVTHDMELKIDTDTVKNTISLLELGEIDKVTSQFNEISVYDLDDDINHILSDQKKTRCVLLLDDAAHAFSPEQQRDFFEFFRKIKSRTISPKAAIYPGVTNFSPTFNIGHDAEEIDVWVNPETEDYYWFMTTMLSRRLPTSVYEKISKEISLLKIICYASFGIPRILFNMVRNVYVEKDEEDSGKYKIQFSRKNVLKQIKQNYNSTLSIYNSLEQKLPTYKNYTVEGISVFEKLIKLLKFYNSDQDITKKAITVAIKKEVTPDLKRILGFFQYAGLVSYERQVSKGEKGVFDLYLINIAALIDNNALLTTKAFKTVDLATAIENRNSHAFTRTKSDYLLSDNTVHIQLSLPPCQSCNTERSNEEARFCAHCGAPLKESSIYNTLINKDINVLQLTTNRISTIKKSSNISTVKDILYDIGHKELQSVPQVGKYWASKIYYLAEEYIS